MGRLLAIEASAKCERRLKNCADIDRRHIVQDCASQTAQQVNGVLEKKRYKILIAIGPHCILCFIVCSANRKR